MQKAHAIQSRTITRLCDAALLLFLLLFVAMVLDNVLYTWDLVGYTGAVLSWTQDDPLILHRQTFEALSLSVPGPAYQSLVTGGYAEAMALNPQDFASQLDMYRIKPLYVALIAGLTAVGMSPVAAGLLLSVLPAVLLCALVYVWLRRLVPPHFALAMTILLSICSRLFDVARVVVPDALSALLLVAAIYLLLERPAWLRWGLGLLVLSILVRSNNVLFVCPLLLYFSYTEYSSHGRSALFLHLLVALVASVLVYLGVSAWFNHQWWRLFHHTFIASINNIDAFALPFSPGLYWQTVVMRLRMIVVGNFVVVTLLLPFLLLSLLVLLQSRGAKPDSRIGQLRTVMMVGYLNVLCYCFLFPLVETWDRFFIPFYVLIVILAASCWHGAATGQHPSRQAPQARL